MGFLTKIKLTFHIFKMIICQNVSVTQLKQNPRYGECYTVPDVGVNVRPHQWKLLAEIFLIFWLSYLKKYRIPGYVRTT